MTEPTTPTDEGTQQGDGGTYTPPASQEELNRIITERVNRTKAQFKDYADLKSKADELDKLQAANQTETERLQSELTRWQSEADRWRTSSVTSRIEALATPDFAYPADAVGKLDPAKYLDAGGAIDDAAIKADLDAILAERPNWRRADGTAPGPRVPAPNHSQGTSAGGGAPVTPRDHFAAIFPKLLT